MENNKTNSNSSNVANNKPKQPIDSSERNRKTRNTIIVIVLVIIFALIFYYSCFKPKTPRISPSNIASPTDSQLTITADGKFYNVKGNNINEWEKNSYSEIIWSLSNRTKYDFYFTTTDNTKESFFVIIDHTGDIYNAYFGSTFIELDPDYSRPVPDLISQWFIHTSGNNAYVPEESVSIWYVLFTQYLPIILLIGFFIWYYRKTMGAGMGGEGESVFSMGKSQAKLAMSNIRFSDVAGIKEEKEELIEIVDYLKHPAKYANMGARTPKGVILYGPPGTGKTLLAKAVAGEAIVPFFQVSGSAFDDMLVGVGAKRVRDLFAKARKAAPSIVFIDEIDSVASKRGKFDMSGGGGVADQTINQLLAEMDGFNTRTGIVVMAATNRLDVLDEAILRPGRFDRHIQVNLPDIKEREEILKIHAKNKNISSSVSLNDIARRTPGFSGAQLENVLNEATLLAVRYNKTVISMAEIDEGIDRVIAGPAKKSRVMKNSEREQVSFHEAGHALVGLYTPGSDVVEKITIIPRGSAGGYTVSNPEKQETQLHTKADLLSMIRELLGGRAAESIKYGNDNISTGASNDLYRASNIARGMVLQLGMTDIGMAQLIPSEGTTNPYQQKMYSETTAYKADQEIERIISTEYEKAHKIIEEHKDELELIVESLLTLETIVKSQIDYIHKNKKLPEEVIKIKENLAKEKLEKEAQKNKNKKEDIKTENTKEENELDKNLN